MAYHDLRDEAKSVREIQRALRDIDYIENGRSRMIVNGIYCNRTKDAIRNFQTLYSLNPTGVVDFETWSLLHKVYHALMDDAQLARKISVFPEFSEYEITKGGADNIIYIIQHMLESVLSLYYDIYTVPFNGIYDEATEEATKAFQRANLLDDTGIMDAKTFNKLADEYERANSLRI